MVARAEIKRRHKNIPKLKKELELSERSQKQEERKKVRQIILSQLRKGPKYRLELHLECCRQLGYDMKPLYDHKGQLSRTCEEMTDYTFDAPLKELYDSQIVRKYRGQREDGKSVMFYEIIKSAEKKE